MVEGSGRVAGVVNLQWTSIPTRISRSSKGGTIRKETICRDFFFQWTNIFLRHNRLHNVFRQVSLAGIFLGKSTPWLFVMVCPRLTPCRFTLHVSYL